MEDAEQGERGGAKGWGEGKERKGRRKEEKGTKRREASTTWGKGGGMGRGRGRETDIVGQEEVERQGDR